MPGLCSASYRGEDYVLREGTDTSMRASSEAAIERELVHPMST